MEVQQQQARGIVDISKQEFRSAITRVRDRVRQQALEPKTEGLRDQLLHRYRMGMAVSGGVFAGLMAGHATSVGVTAFACFGTMMMAALFFAAIGKIQGPLDEE